MGDKRVFGWFFVKFGVQGDEGKKRQIWKKMSNGSLYRIRERYDVAGIRGGPLYSSNDQWGGVYVRQLLR